MTFAQRQQRKHFAVGTIACVLLLALNVAYPFSEWRPALRETTRPSTRARYKFFRPPWAYSFFPKAWSRQRTPTQVSAKDGTTSAQIQTELDIERSKASRTLAKSGESPDRFSEREGSIEAHGRLEYDNESHKQQVSDVQSSYRDMDSDPPSTGSEQRQRTETESVLETDDGEYVNGVYYNEEEYYYPWPEEDPLYVKIGGKRFRVNTLTPFVEWGRSADKKFQGDSEESADSASNAMLRIGGKKYPAEGMLALIGVTEALKEITNSSYQGNSRTLYIGTT
eukprot:1345829-Amorphochlora_amoeboformis.AAC.2